VRGIQHQLHDSIAVAQIDEDKAAVIASRLDPSPESDLAAYEATAAAENIA
jgi:hypothetical protein